MWIRALSHCDGSGIMSHMPKENRSGYYILLATLFLEPLAFWPSPYFAIEAVKTIVIVIGVLLSAVLLLLPAVRSGRWGLPPKSLVWMPVLIVASLVASSMIGGHFVKSFFGQGFELGAGVFMVVLFIAYFAVFSIVARKADRVGALYAAIVLPFLILFVFQLLRLVFGAGFAPLGVLNGVTSSLLGSWYGLAMYALAVALISISALSLIAMSGRLKAVYWIVLAAAFITAVVVNDQSSWLASAAAFLGLAIYLSMRKARPEGGMLVSRLKRLSWLPIIAFVVSAVLWYGNPAITAKLAAINVNYGEVSLSWQGTLDVAAGELKAAPLFGSGPNRFVQAYLANKPAGINQTDAWGLEFSTGFGLIPTFLVTQGIVGGILWTLFLVFFGIAGVKSLKRRPTAEGAPGVDPRESFILASSFFSAAFLWLVSVISVPPHAVLFLAFVLTGIWLGAAVHYGKISSFSVEAVPGSRSAMVLNVSSMALLAVLVVLALACVKDTAALAYFDAGVQRLTAGDASGADGAFRTSLVLDPMDVYWQGRAEAALAQANALASSVSAGASASSTQAIAAQAAAAVNQAFTYSESAIKDDPSNYYNYISEARVAQAATSLNMSNGYDTAVSAYKSAISLNPGNPSLYVSLAQFQANNNKLDDALQTMGAALQVKNNYLNSVFLLSQIDAAKGNLADAITAAQFAISLNPQNPLLYFQLGLLQYTDGKYSDAAVSLSQAVSLQPGYANAQYYLGLSDARIGKNAEALSLFEALDNSNPNNENVGTVLNALRAGKSPFVSAATGASTAKSKDKSQPPVK